MKYKVAEYPAPKLIQHYPSIMILNQIIWSDLKMLLRISNKYLTNNL